MLQNIVLNAQIIESLITISNKQTPIIMKGNLISIIISICCIVNTHSYASTPIISVHDSIVGTSNVTGVPIKAQRYAINGKLSGWHWDGISDNLLLEIKDFNNRGMSFKNSGTINMIDLKTKDLKWKRPINFNSSKVNYQGENLFLSEKKKNLCINPETGIVMWKNRNEFYFIDPFQNIGIGYPIHSMSNRLTAVDLTNGKELWKSKIERSSGWDDAYMLNDSILLISVDGINALNLKSGMQWTYKASTSNKEIGKMIGINILGIIVGLISDSYFYQTQPDISYDMVSNMLIDPYENIIMASNDKISKLDSYGQIIWSSPLTKKKTSKSSLFLIDSKLYMINTGYGQYNGNFSLIGEPYIASFDLNSGKEIFKTIVTENNDFIRNYQVVNDILFLVFKDKLITYSLNDGSKSNEIRFQLDENEQFDRFVETGIYWKDSDSYFRELSSYYSNHNLLMTSNGRVFVLTDNLETVLIYDKRDLYHKSINNPKYELITNNNYDYIILNNSNTPIASITANDDLFINRDKLYSVDNESFWEIDLNQIYQSPTLWQYIFDNVYKYIH